MPKRRSRSRSESRRPAASKPAGARRAESALGRRAARVVERSWPAFLAAAVALLAWAARGALFGVPTADDYVYLYSLKFQRPLDWFGSMGAPYYWRPLSRQAYYAALGPALFAAPWLAAFLHAALLFATSSLLYRIARRALPAPAALAVAVFPLLAEPARVLLVWPTGAQYLIPMAAAVLAVHEALADRPLTAALATLAALLAHEAASPLLLLLPAIAWARRRPRAEVARWVAVAVATGAVWLAGRLVARAHGVPWLAVGSPAAGAGARLHDLWTVLGRGLAAQLDLEDLRAPWWGLAAVLYAVVAAAALGFAVADRRARTRLGARWPALAGAAAWFVAGIAPMALLLPDWEAWRTSLAALGLAIAVAGGLALVRPWLAYAFVAVRLVALLVATPAPSIVMAEVPHTTSGISLTHVVRWQRVAESARRVLLAAHPTLPRGAAVAYWARMAMSEVALAEPRAPKVWYADSTLRWHWYFQDRELRNAAAVAFDPYVPSPAVAIDPRAFTAYDSAQGAMRRGDDLRAESLFVLADGLQRPRRSTEFTSKILYNRALIALQERKLAKAEQLNDQSLRLRGATAGYFAVAALLALERRQLPLATEALRRGLELQPKEPNLQLVARALQQMSAPGGAGGAPGAP